MNRSHLIHSNKITLNSLIHFYEVHLNTKILSFASVCLKYRKNPCELNTVLFYYHDLHTLLPFHSIKERKILQTTIHFSVLLNSVQCSELFQFTL